MDPKFIVNLQGKDYPTYPGVLAEAHEKGLRSIHTQLLQIPDEANGHTAIVKAVVTMENWEVGGTEDRHKIERAFEGIGDASPRNVNSKIATALIRMAETRAKGRALRDAINCGATMLEELPGDEEHEEKPRQFGSRDLSVIGSPKERADAALIETAARNRDRMAALPQTGSGMTPIGATKGPVKCGVCGVPFTIEQIAHCDKHSLEYVHPKCYPKVNDENA